MTEAALNLQGYEAPTQTETPTEAPAPAPEPPVADTTWYKSLPEDIQTWDEVKNSPSPEAFYKQVSDMRSMIGRSLQIPGPDASQEAREKYLNKVLERTPEIMLRPGSENMDDFYASLGRPEAPDKYTLSEDITQGNYDEDSVNAFRPVAHEAGLNQKQFEAIVAKMSANTAHRQEQAMQAHQEQLQALKGEWGLAFDQNLKIADKVRQEFFPQLNLPIDKMDAHSIKSLQMLGKALGGEKINLTQDQGEGSAITPAEAKEKIDEIMENKEHAYWNAQHPGHKAAVQKVVDLHKFLNTGR
jgi:hypothetical protein